MAEEESGGPMGTWTRLSQRNRCYPGRSQSSGMVQKGCQPGPYWSTECSQPAVLQRPGCSKGLYSGIHVGQYRRGIIGKSERRIERNGVCDDRTPAACCPTADIKLVDSR